MSLFSKLDYCIALLTGLPVEQLQKLQKVQIYAAKIIHRKKKTDHVTPLLKSLHWLPVKERVDYKIATLVFKCLNDLAPTYLSDLIQKNTTSRNLRSSNDKSIFIPRTKLKTYGDRAFSYYGPYIWNSLPRELREKERLDCFKKALKYYLFLKAYAV